MEPTNPSPPEVFFKTTEISKIKGVDREKKNKSVIVPNEYGNVYLKGKDKEHHTANQVHFYSSLRKNKGIS